MNCQKEGRKSTRESRIIFLERILSTSQYFPTYKCIQNSGRKYRKNRCDVLFCLPQANWQCEFLLHIPESRCLSTRRGLGIFSSRNSVSVSLSLSHTLSRARVMRTKWRSETEKEGEGGKSSERRYYLTENKLACCSNYLLRIPSPSQLMSGSHLFYDIRTRVCVPRYGKARNSYTRPKNNFLEI